MLGMDSTIVRECVYLHLQVHWGAILQLFANQFLSISEGDNFFKHQFICYNSALKDSQCESTSRQFVHEEGISLHLLHVLYYRPSNITYMPGAGERKRCWLRHSDWESGGWIHNKLYLLHHSTAAAQQTTFFNTTSSSRSDSDEREVESAVLKGIFSPRPGTTSQPRNTKRNFA